MRRLVIPGFALVFIATGCNSNGYCVQASETGQAVLTVCDSSVPTVPLTLSSNGRTVAVSLPTTTASLAIVRSNPQDSQFLVSLLKVAGDSQILASDGFSAATASLARAMTGALTDGGKADSLGSCQTQAGSVVTYSGCSIGGTTPMAWNGTVAIDGYGLTLHLAGTGNSGGTQFSYDINGTIALGYDSVDGALAITIGYNPSGSSQVQYKTDVTFNAIALDGSQCPIGGSLGIHDVLTMPSQSMVVVIGVTYTGSCGQLSATHG